MPEEVLVPLGGRLLPQSFPGPEPGDPSVLFEIQITVRVDVSSPVAPAFFRRPDRTTVVSVEEVDLGVSDRRQLAGKTVRIPRDEEQDAAVYLATVHNPVRLRRLRFGPAGERSIPAEVELAFDFRHVAPGRRSFPGRWTSAGGSPSRWSPTARTAREAAGQARTWSRRAIRRSRPRGHVGFSRPQLTAPPRRLSGVVRRRAARPMAYRRLGAAFLLAQAAGGLVWWCLLLAWPPSRAPFLARGAPEVTLLSFAVADGILFVGTSAAAAYGLWGSRQWAWPLLCVHAGAAGYAGLYCWTLTALTGGDGLLGAVLMTPSLVIPGVLVWVSRPEGRGAC